MSLFHRLAPFMSEGTDPCRHTNEHPKVCLSRPLALSSPVVKKKTIQIPSFDERGLIFERHNAKLSTAERSCDSVFAKTSVPSSWSKACRQRDSGERASTLPRVKPKAHSSQSLSAKPSIAISPAPEPNSPPTPPLLKSKPSSSLHLPASRSMDFSPILHRPEPKPSVSPTLTVPTPRLSPSPTSQNSDGPGGRQPSPVARERRARCIPISNTKVEPLGVAKHEVLDQGALLDFTRPGARRARPAMSRESRHQTHAPHNPRLLLNQVETNENEDTAKNKPQTPTVNSDNAAMPKSNIKQQRKCQSSDSAECSEVVYRGSQPGFYGLARQESSYPQSSDFISSHQSREEMYSGKSTALKKSAGPPLSLFSANSETRGKQLDLLNETPAVPSRPIHRRPWDVNERKTSLGNSPEPFQHVGESQSIEALHKGRFSSESRDLTAQMDGKCSVIRPPCVSKDYSCQSRVIDLQSEDAQCAHGLNRLKTRLLASQTREASHPTSRGAVLKPDLQPHRCRSNQENTPEQHNSHPERDARGKSLNHTDVSGPPDHHVVPKQLLEHPGRPSVAPGLFDTNSFGSGSKRVFDLPQDRIYQRPDSATSAQMHQLRYSVTDRAFITEDSEDPYYVTMYYPGSVYVGEYKETKLFD